MAEDPTEPIEQVVLNLIGDHSGTLLSHDQS